MAGVAADSRKNDFGLGCLALLLVNFTATMFLVGIGALLFAWDPPLPSAVANAGSVLLYCGLPLFLNVGALILLARKRVWLAWGGVFSIAATVLLLVALGAATFWYFFVSGY